MGKEHWVWLGMLITGNSNRFRELLGLYAGAADIYEDRHSPTVRGLLSKDALSKLDTLDDAKRMIELCEKDGIGICAYSDIDYPPRLRASLGVVPCLYYSGNLKILDGVTLAGVGTRNLTQYGRDAVREICTPLAKAGITLVSGLAIGIDSEVHKTALENGSPTAAVLGSAINETTPHRHEGLRRRIEESGGLVISEYHPGTKTQPFMFAARNRIVAGISSAVMVFEAAENSGSLITANNAIDDGRDVFSVPGSIFSRSSSGTNNLINRGATLLNDAQIVIDRFGVESTGHTEPNYDERPPEPRNEAESSVAELLKSGEKTLDELADRTGIPVSELITTLSLMELEGMVTALPGPRYSLV